MQAIQSQRQVSAGDVAFRNKGGQTDVVLISVGDDPRWQLPKGMINQGETIEAAAQREVREEAGVDTEMVGPIDTIDYWFLSGKGARRTRHHKFVHFFLFRYLTGDPADHDHEVNEAKWVEINQAIGMLTFESERRVAEMAREMLLSSA